MNPLTESEAALLYHVGMFGSDSYPIAKHGRSWWIDSWREWTGFPCAFPTRKAAREQFERWQDVALERWNATRQPGQILTGVGIRQT